MELLLNIIHYVVPFIILLGILVFVHEFGHFIVARLCGVQVSAFSIGFGKELWGRMDKRGTYWKISAVPLGGYCQFLGDADASSSTEDEAVHLLTEDEKKRAFPYQNPFKKLAIVVAGPAFNYLFAILIYASLFAILGKFNVPPIVNTVFQNSAAEEAGILVGDRIMKIEGRQVSDVVDVLNEFALAVKPETQIEIKRGDELITFDVTLKQKITDDVAKSEGRKYFLGVGFSNNTEVTYEKVSLLKSFALACNEVWSVSVMTLRGVGQMVSGKRGGEDIGGVIRIAEMTGDISKSHKWSDLFLFMALISVNLGLINLFPIPVLDGGHVVFYLLEIVSGKELNERIKTYLFKAGFALLMALMIFATWNDVVHLVNRWFNI